ncbi:LytR/AlgR family response regulator transcription factor [Aquimarina pacifica]|uniref:LytR/AlgR family response regulator transcription factor n=1 Tax=Aquimarina pacifica TaxID=1296415 RepID=UPI000471827C|nr:LytTR family DNA-binding domain-containing protein [Aquimarina pacifica]
MNILIVEDEPRAANQLQNMLKSSNIEYHLLDIIDTIEDSVKWFKQHNAPDLVFMDIQLADGLSFEIFQKVAIDMPIIFTTAFDQYAIQAFKVNSIDYLLKPIQQEELENAMHKFFKSNKSSSIDSTVLEKLMNTMQVTNKREGILVKEGSSFVQIKVVDLLYVYSEESITFGVTMGKRYIIDETMDQLFESLDTRQFFRINRGQIVSKMSIEKIDPYFNHRIKLSILKSKNQEFVVSRQKTSGFKEWLNK